jgi:hypothetical protein
MPVNVEPTLDKPIPSHAYPQRGEDEVARAKIAGNTALLLEELGASFDMTPEDNAKAAEMFNTMGKSGEVTEREKQLKNPGFAVSLYRYINDYERQIVQDKVQVRTIVTNRLLEISESEDHKVALKALELLGKASDLFTERSEITITHQTSDELKLALREKIRLLMEMNTIDINPTPQKIEKQPNDDVVDVESYDDSDS